MNIVILGDSLTSGHGIDRAASFPSTLQAKLETARLPYRIVNEGISGDTTAGGLRRAMRVLGDEVRVLVLALGINDGLRGVPVAQVKSNLAAIIREAKAREIRVLLCRMEALPLYGREYASAFHRLYDELAAEYHVPLVPFFLQSIIGNRSLLQRDLLHPNAAGASVIADQVWPYLRAELSAGD